MKRLYYHLRCLGIVAFLLAMAYVSVGQDRDTLRYGEISGIVADSVHHFRLSAATVAAYSAGKNDSVLLQYSLSNNFGEFKLGGLPVNTALVLQVTYTGYYPGSMAVFIPAGKKQLSMGNIYLTTAGKELEEVLVTARIPPMQMKGDTLEFNADAFKLDKTAVVEDLLRKLPGITVWSDGVITVNGREVKNVYVEGKPFFGNDNRVALRNIPKASVQKIQVFKESSHENILDSITDINIKLKKGHKHGVFGKVGAGYGTTDRFESDGSISFFGPGMQLSLAGAANNVNKSAGSVKALLSNAAYKQAEPDMAFQPDFQKEGITRIQEGGMQFRYDFTDGIGNYQRNDIEAGAYITDASNTISKDLQNIIAVGRDSVIRRLEQSDARLSDIRQQYQAGYEKSDNRRSFHLSSGLVAGSGHIRSSVKQSVLDGDDALSSYSERKEESKKDLRELTLFAGFRNQKDYLDNSRSPKDVEVKYNLKITDIKDDRFRMNRLMYVRPIEMEEYFNRNYITRKKEYAHQLFLDVGGIRRLLFNKMKLFGIQVNIRNTLDLVHRDEDASVTDGDTLSGMKRLNAYLSNNAVYSALKVTPGLQLKKAFLKYLANRYEKQVSISFLQAVEFFHQRNNSIKAFQQIGRNYFNFKPEVRISYVNHQLGDFRRIISLSYSAPLVYPDIYQMAPLTDSSDSYYWEGVNLHLKEYRKREIEIALQHDALNANNILNYALSLSGGYVHDYIVDSNYYDTGGRTIHYAANSNGYKYARLWGHVRKAFRVKHNQLQLNFDGSLNLSSMPSYINNELYISRVVNGSENLTVSYSLQDRMMVQLGQRYMSYRSSRPDDVDLFKNSVLSFSVSVSGRCTSRMLLSTNLTYNQNRSFGSPALDFTIWNASASYRFLKSRNAEVKLSTLDLLRQNSSIINYGADNNILRGNVNVLQQYFMLTLAYYPRKFGRKDQ